MQSIIYRSPFIYRLIMRILYRRDYVKRLSSIAQCLEQNSSLLEVCCGPCDLYTHLKNRKVRYTGVDYSDAFVESAKRRGIDARKVDLLKDDLPAGEFDCVLMQASLYQFIPHHSAILEKLFASSKKMVIVSEPVRNMADSKIPLVAALAKFLTRSGAGEAEHRFTEQSFDGAMMQYSRYRPSWFLLPGGREKVYVFHKA